MKHPSILIVDDEPDNFDVIETLLSEEDYLLYYAASGQEALSSLDTYNPNLILLDVMMPEIDGLEVCQRIKAIPRWQSVPIVMITALTAKEDLARCLKFGADDFISKPVNGLELRARVHSMLRIKHQFDNLQTLLELREDMVNAVVHDLRNPLTDILLGVALLQRVEYSRAEQQEKFTQIHSSAQKLQGLVNDLLQIALMESGKLCLNCIEVDLCELIQSTLSNFEAIAAQKNQVLSAHFSEKQQKKLSLDPTLIQRVVDNLLANAIKFSPRNSHIFVNVEFPTSGNPKIQVIDSGAGVPDILQQKIFEKYEVGTPMPDISQIGLGLAFCKLAVEAHGGNICVKSNQPQGAIFEVALPA
jgi:two-component system sensor histidine kinase/response regulator